MKINCVAKSFSKILCEKFEKLDARSECPCLSDAEKLACSNLAATYFDMSVELAVRGYVRTRLWHDFCAAVEFYRRHFSDGPEISINDGENLLSKKDLDTLDQMIDDFFQRYAARVF